MKRNYMSLILVVLFLLLEGCGPGNPTAPVIPSGDQVATSVAATLSAQSQNNPSPGIQPTSPDINPTPTPIVPTQPPPPPPPPASVLRVAFVDSNRNLWSWQQGGTPKQLNNTGDAATPILSPDGQMIVFLRLTADYKASIWAINFDGSAERSLVSLQDFDALKQNPAAVGLDPADAQFITSISPTDIKFIPGTHTLSFMTYPQFEGPGYMPDNDVWFVNVDNGQRTQFLLPKTGGTMYYSPDGKQAAIVNSSSISLINVDGSNRRDNVLTYKFINTASEYAWYAEPSWAPGSNYLRVFIPPEDPWGTPGAPTALWQIPVDGTPAAQFSTILHYGLLPIGISPDLNRVAYLKTVGDPTQNIRELRIANFDGSNDTVYATGESVQFMVWSPDSTRFVFRGPAAGDNLSLGQVGAGGTPLSDTGYAQNVQWVDANQFLFFSKTPGALELRLGTVGQSSTLVASLPGTPDLGKASFTSVK